MKQRTAATLFLFAAFLTLSGSAAAQPIAANPEFRVGKLGNGLTYYLCHNEKPEGCAEFYIAHNVGALQEEDNQNGLAHFLEHMAFNGTRHYPDKGVLDFLAKEGVRFGYNVNAYTSRTETVYNISKVPLVRESFTDSVLMVLHDWSCDISCDQKALDEERGVISEEWRFRNDSRTRMNNRQIELIYKGSKQAERDVIGTLEVINGFKREEILDFYHKWYRPDLQAIIIVGDFDADWMEARVKKLFSDIPPRVNPEPKQAYVPPVQEETIFEDMTDPEIKYQALKAIFKQRWTVTDPSSTEFFKDFFCRQIVSSIMADRLKERCKEKDAPVQSATLVTGSYRPQMYVSLLTAVPKKKEDLLEGLAFVETEVRRLLLHGISEEEMEVAKLGLSSRMHLDTGTSREETASADIIKTALGNFLQGAPLVMPGEMKSIQKACLEAITPDDVAPYPGIMFRDCEKIYSNCYNNVEENGIAPSSDLMKKTVAEADASAPGALFLEYPDLDLDVNAAPGSIASVSAVKGADMEKWVLSNGVQVFYKEAAPVKDGNHLVMTLLFDTGYRSFDPEKVTASRFAAAYNKRNTGFRDCSRPDMKNYPELSGMNLTLSGGDQAARIEISSRADKAETAFKAAWLQLSEPYFGKPGDLKRQKAVQLKSLGKQKSKRELYDRKCRDLEYGNHPWMDDLDSAAVQAADMALVEDVFKRFYGDITSMKAVICSDLPRDEIRTLVEKYLASLDVPYPYQKGKYLQAKPAFKGRLEIKESNPPAAAPYTDISWNWFFKGGRSPKERAGTDILSYIMSARYLALIREERGGAYSVSFRTENSNEASLPSRSFVDLRTRPEMRELLLKDLEDEMARMCKYGPTAEEMELAVKYLVKHHSEEEAKVSKSIAAQEDRMLRFVRWGIPYGYDYESIVRAVKPGEIRAMARRLASGSKLIEVYTEE